MLVETLAEKPATREDVTAFLGSDGGGDSSDAWRRRVTPRSPYLTNVSVYSIPGNHIEVAVEVGFSEEPARGSVARALGPLEALPQHPNARPGTEGKRLAHHRKGEQALVNVFVGLDPKDENKMAKLQVEVEGKRD